MKPLLCFPVVPNICVLKPENRTPRHENHTSFQIPLCYGVALPLIISLGLESLSGCVRIGSFCFVFVFVQYFSTSERQLGVSHGDTVPERGKVFLWTLELIPEKTLEGRLKLCVPLCLYNAGIVWGGGKKRGSGRRAPLEPCSLFHIEKRTFLCRQRPARLSGTSFVASTVAWGVFFWVGFVLFQKQQSAGCRSVQGRTVLIELVGELVSTIKVPHLPGRLLPSHRCQNVRSHIQ